MKLHVPTLISRLDACITREEADTRTRNQEIEAKNRAAKDDWEQKLPALAAAAKAFAKEVSLKSFHGDVGKAERDALVGAGLLTEGYGANTFRGLNRPTARSHWAAQTEELVALRKLLATAAKDDEYVSVSFLERLGFRSSQLSKVYRGVFTTAVSK